MLLTLLIIWLRSWQQAPTPARVDFQKDICPILQRCQPCHFTGGQMYQRLPFDRPETVTKLGTKLFTRIRDEKQREVIRRFLAGK